MPEPFPGYTIMFGVTAGAGEYEIVEVEARAVEGGFLVRVRRGRSIWLDQVPNHVLYAKREDAEKRRDELRAAASRGSR